MTDAAQDTHKGRWKLTIEYDGTPFIGWQRQDKGLSVQQCLEEAVHKFCGEDVTAHVAGRTDAGVHAVGQVAHIDLAKATDARAVRDAINFYLRPQPISIISAEPVPPEFHARFGAVKRYYCYKIIMARRPEPVLEAHRAWHVGWDLDIAKMNKAAKHLLGAHDYTSFRASECQAKSPLRSIDRLEFTENKFALGAGRHIELWAEARSFLHHQIRNMVGTLKLVGEGKWQPDDVKAALDAKDRSAAGPTAPPHGLYFMRVDYGSTFTKAMDTLL